ncbi:acyl carrier protein [Lichenicoccus sp.]|uniref:acyl carrier protein n=1 Tax=Lichenicoccus sp. TaxID=2781899 RepID=UPI003D0AC915
MSTDMETITRLIVETLVANPKVTRPVVGATVIVEDLGLDSLAVMNFVMQIEDKLDVSLPLDRLADVRTVDDLAHCFAQLKAQS